MHTHTHHQPSIYWGNGIKPSWKDRKLFDLDTNGASCSEAVLNLIFANGFHISSDCLQIKTTYISQLTASKLDYNWRFLVEFFATFAPVGIPSLAKFKA